MTARRIEARQRESPPTDYQLIVPYGWFQLSLDPERRDKGIIALADRQFRGVDNAPHLKEQFMRELQKKAKDGYKVGGIELYLSTLTVGPLPLSSSLLVSFPDPANGPGPASPEELAGRLRGTGADARVVDLFAAGAAVRERRKDPPSPETRLGSTLESTTVLYHVPIPAGGAWLMMTFSTSLEPLADRMVELFDVVAGTLQWR